MKVFIQQISTGLFLSAASRWVRTAKRARLFEGITVAIDFCVERAIREVRLVLRFGDPKSDLLLHPFGRDGKQPTALEFRSWAVELIARKQDLAEQGQALLADLDRIGAEAKERRKAYPFKPAKVRKPPTEDGDAPSEKGPSELN